MLNRVSRTLLGSLASRANFGDPMSLKAHQFLKTKDLTMGNFLFRPCLDRTAIYDQAVLDFIKMKPNASILNIGCGFCMRFFRVDNGQITWTEMDYPEVGELRSEFLNGVVKYEENNRYSFLGQNLKELFNMDYDLIIAEGVMVYLPKSRVMELTRIKKNRMIFDVFTKNRTVKLGTDQLWLFDEREWDLNIINRWFYDSPSREACVMELV